jgi:deoxyribodipyrimidine photo-lyase
MPRTILVWFRRDLRLADNPALAAALAEGTTVVPVYVHSPAEEAPWAPGAASDWWLHHSLAALDHELRERGSRLCIRRGPALPALLELARECGASAVHWNRLYEPALVARDTGLKTALQEHGLEANSCNGALLVEPWTLRTGQGAPYRVFTPFWRAAQQQLDALPPPTPAPLRLPAPPEPPHGMPLDALALLPRVRWDRGLAATFTPGEAAALQRLESFCDDAVDRYAEDRNRPDLPGSSRLSPHLHFGELSPRQCLAACRAAGAQRRGGARGIESFVRELGWREFAHHLLFHFPHTTDAALDPRFDGYPWREDPAALQAWQRGRTGFPIVDAGMRELWHTGWMHNRVRMVVASLLTKNLGQHWLAGARWFWDTLVDADLASNTLGWQWTAGCGADAAPYFRIFNPVLQGERHDPAGAYVRRWVPELAQLPDRWLFQPDAAPAAALDASGIVLGRDYPHPIIDFRASREQALAGYAMIRGPLA